MSDDFLSCGVVLRTLITIIISNSSSMMASFIMIALGMKGKAANHLPNLTVIRFEVLSSIYIA